METGLLLDDLDQIVWGYLRPDGRPRYVTTKFNGRVGKPVKLYHFIEDFPPSHHIGIDQYMGCWIGQKSIICDEDI